MKNQIIWSNAKGGYDAPQKIKYFVERKKGLSFDVFNYVVKVDFIKDDWFYGKWKSSRLEGRVSGKIYKSSTGAALIGEWAEGGNVFKFVAVLENKK